MKEIITWQASVKVNGVWHTTKEYEDLHEVMELVEQMANKLQYRYFVPTIVRNVKIVADDTVVEAK